MIQPPEESFIKAQAYSLSELNAAIRETLEVTFPNAFWLIAEISEARCNSKGHCYLELVERKDETVIAQMRATIWAYTYRNISRKFEKTTGKTLGKGMQVLLLADIAFHEVYGLSLNVKDIDPAYSLGEMARKKRETIERLNQEGFIDLNKTRPFPLVPQRIAVLSSSTAAGYGDFVTHIDNNPYEYKIYHELYQSLMQGQEAEESILYALSHIREKIDLYDAIVIIRGGGSQVDLSCFDSYRLAVEVAKFPLPVITGIGHERDDTVVDLVAHTRMKTPTAVAGFIIDGIRTFEEKLLGMQGRLIHKTKDLLKEEDHRFRHIVYSFTHIITERFHNEDKRLHAAVHRLTNGANRAIDSSANKVGLNSNKLKLSVRSLFQAQENRLKHVEQGLRLLDPVNVLKRGYSITYLNTKAVKDISALTEGDIIQTKLYHGLINSRVEDLNEEQ
ncbi:MAG TPA: exodeoxyribonuclease VII large subunit [Nitrospiraceae bacterium]|jgi:exodeoxyribonuclease VII large subunit|nr:exodeoxyribonuclease VII large subunit [Nitrospiraceae bacterium]